MRLPARYLSILILLALALPLAAQPVFREGLRHAPPEHAATIPATLPDVAVEAVPSERPAVPQSLPPISANGTNGLSLVGFISYQFVGSTAQLHADRVENTSTTRTSGTLRLTLWMSQGTYRQSGYRTAIYTMGQLAPNSYFAPVDSGTITFTAPPTGCYYVSMLLEEFQSDGSYAYVDYLDFSNLISINGGCCTYAFSSPSTSIGAGSGNGSVGVTVNASFCNWTATSNATWLTILSGSATGNGTVTYSYSANPSTSSRSATITLTGGATYSVTQAGATPNACSYSYAPTSNNIGAAAYNGSVTVTGTPAGCSGSWSASSNAGWLTITSGGSGSGAGPVSLSYSATANTSSQSRNGAISINGTFFNVTQAGVAAGCTQNDTTLCLANNRFKLSATWKTTGGQTGDGHAVSITPDTGYYWFFGSTNVEMVVKVIDACTFNQHFWVFAGGLTDVNVNLTVTDTKTGVVRTYTNPVGVAFQPIQDTSAFPTCQ